MKRILLLAMLASPGWSDPGSELQGAWTLWSVNRAGQELKDPRWTWMISFDSRAFALSSSQVTEKHLLAKDGSAQVQAVSRTVDLRGSYDCTSNRLRLHPQLPLTAEQRDFAEQHFGKPDSSGTYSCDFECRGNLRLRIGSDSWAHFQRHKKTAR